MYYTLEQELVDKRGFIRVNNDTFDRPIADGLMIRVMHYEVLREVMEGKKKTFKIRDEFSVNLVYDGHEISLVYEDCDLERALRDAKLKISCMVANLHKAMEELTC